MNASMASISLYNISSPIQEASLLSLGLNNFQIWKEKNGIQMAQITVEITPWLKGHVNSL